MKKLKIAFVTGALAAAAMAAPASAADIIYMTGTSNPWGNTANNAAMNTAFGAGNYQTANGFNVSAFDGTYDFVYLDGGDGISGEFDAFLAANVALIESFVNGGGTVFLNAARWTNPTLDLGFGTQLIGEEYSNNAALTADGIAAGLGANGAGTAWTGTYFSHDVVTGVDTCYVSGDYGCVFGNVGGLFVGGQTSTNFHSAGGDQLRVNQLLFAARGADFQGAVPEPMTWMMLILGFLGIGGLMRRKNAAARPSTLRVTYS